jgi:predicted RNA binding protein YcfA (HicA-like mRNA interferase family)
MRLGFGKRAERRFRSSSRKVSRPAIAAGPRVARRCAIWSKLARKWERSCGNFASCWRPFPTRHMNPRRWEAAPTCTFPTSWDNSAIGHHAGSQVFRRDESAAEHESPRGNSHGGAGWVALVNQEGSHRQFKHSEKTGRVTIAGHPSMDLDPKTQNSILKQAGLK